MHTIELDHTPLVSIELKIGQAWLLYFDNGPEGPCGQSMRITCPHATLHTFPSETELRQFLDITTFRNSKAQIMYGVVGEWTSPGVFSIVSH